MPRGIPAHPVARHERDAARAARNDRVEEVILLCAALSKKDHPLHRAEWHLAPARKQGPAGGAMPYALCVHIRRDWNNTGEVTERRLNWLIGDIHRYAYFKGLELRPCHSTTTRNDKMRWLADWASQ